MPRQTKKPALRHHKPTGQARVQIGGRDGYGRILGEVYLDGRHINLEMVKEGWAWHYVKYSKSEKLAAAEAEARDAEVGLWSDPKPQSPWEFREAKKAERLSK